MTQELAAYGYLIAAICFIMALRGLSSPVSSRQGNLFGIIGMVVAIGVTIATPGVVSPCRAFIGHAPSSQRKEFSERAGASEI